MGGRIYDERKEQYDDEDELLENEDVEVEEVDEDDVDNNDGLDLGGDQDEDVDKEDEDDENTDIEEIEEEDELDVDLDEQEENEEESDGEDDEEVDEEPQVSEKDAKIAELERQHEVDETKYVKFEQQVKDTLEKLGIPVNGDVKEALDRTAAEMEGKTLEEYRREKDEKAEIENARQTLARQKFEQLAASDLAELKKSFPDLLKADNIRKCFDSMEDFIQFGKLRDSGVAPKTAYMAVNGEKVRTAQAQAVQKKVASGGKNHITSVAPKKASDSNVVMPKAELQEWRNTFPDLSDAEIRKLYKETL